jgi:surfeit locus 1 family protein
MVLHWNWKLALFTAVFLPLTIGLGYWQLQRAEEKLVVQANMAERQQPVILSSIQQDSDQLAYQQVTWQGHFVSPYIWLLDNQVVNGQVGYDVLGLVREHRDEGNGRLILVNRGWITQGEYRQQLPQVSHPSGLLDFQGTIYVPTGQPLLLMEDDLQQSIYPQLLQIVDVSLLQKTLDKSLFAYQLRLNQQSDGVLQAHWISSTMSPERHLGYALQWFGLALTLAILFIYQTVVRTETSIVINAGD